MKIRSRIPWGYRVLGLVALSGLSLAVQAEDKIVLLTSWYAQAEQGGYYQAQATGIYKNMVWTSTFAPAAPRLTACSCCYQNGLTSLSATICSCWKAFSGDSRPKPLPPPFSMIPRGC